MQNANTGTELKSSCGCTSYNLLFCQVVRLFLMEKRKAPAHKTKVFNSLLIIMLHKKNSSGFSIKLLHWNAIFFLLPKKDFQVWDQKK